MSAARRPVMRICSRNRQTDSASTQQKSELPSPFLPGGCRYSLPATEGCGNMRLDARAGARNSIPYARLETSKRWMVACDFLTAAWTQHHPARSRFCARRRAACSLTRRRAKPRLKPHRRPRSELFLHRLRPGRMLVRAPDLTSSWPSRKAEPRQHQRGSNPRRTRGGRRALRAAPRSAAPSSWAVVAHTAVPSIEPCPRGAWPLT